MRYGTSLDQGSASLVSSIPDIRGGEGDRMRGRGGEGESGGEAWALPTVCTKAQDLQIPKIFLSLFAFESGSWSPSSNSLMWYWRSVLQKIRRPEVQHRLSRFSQTPRTGFNAATPSTSLLPYPRDLPLSPSPMLPLFPFGQFLGRSL